MQVCAATHARSSSSSTFEFGPPALVPPRVQFQPPWTVVPGALAGACSPGGDLSRVCGAFRCGGRVVVCVSAPVSFATSLALTRGDGGVCAGSASPRRLPLLHASALHSGDLFPVYPLRSVLVAMPPSHTACPFRHAPAVSGLSVTWGWAVWCGGVRSRTSRAGLGAGRNVPRRPVACSACAQPSLPTAVTLRARSRISLDHGLI